MAQVFTDPEELEAFADRLSMARQVIQQERVRIASMLKRLGSSWRDEEYRKFEAAFTAVQKVLDEFTKEVERVVPHLHQDAQDIKQFQQTRLPG